LRRRKGDIDEPFDEIIVTSEAFGSDLTEREAQWVAGCLRAAVWEARNGF
jgi:hypothetical protein